MRFDWSAFNKYFLNKISKEKRKIGEFELEISEMVLRGQEAVHSWRFEKGSRPSDIEIVKKLSEILDLEDYKMLLKIVNLEYIQQTYEDRISNLETQVKECEIDKRKNQENLLVLNEIKQKYEEVISELLRVIQNHNAYIAKAKTENLEIVSYLNSQMNRCSQTINMIENTVQKLIQKKESDEKFFSFCYLLAFLAIISLSILSLKPELGESIFLLRLTNELIILPMLFISAKTLKLNCRNTSIWLRTISLICFCFVIMVPYEAGRSLTLLGVMVIMIDISGFSYTYRKSGITLFDKLNEIRSKKNVLRTKISQAYFWFFSFYFLVDFMVNIING